jgi:hypothetical protein
MLKFDAPMSRVERAFSTKCIAVFSSAALWQLPWKITPFWNLDTKQITAIKFIRKTAPAVKDA